MNRKLISAVAILSVFTGVTFADTIKTNIDVVLNGVNISVNGNKVKADNILYNGTTYVPLRSVAEMLGKDVGWDAATNTAGINDKNVISSSNILKIGDTAELEGFKITLNNVRVSSGKNYMKPTDGKKFVIADITLENTTQEPNTVSSMTMIKLIDSNKYSCDISYFADTKGQLSGELGVGRQMRGEVAFEAPINEGSYELIFDANMFTAGQKIFNITLK